NEHRHVFHVVIERVTKRDHLDQRRKKEKKERQRIAPDDDKFFEQDRAKSAERFVFHVPCKERRFLIIWGPQAASLLASAACRRLQTRCKNSAQRMSDKLFGRLPKRTGWQPVLPRTLHARP